MDNFKEQFIAEALELLMKLEKELLLLEERPGDISLIEEIFRGLHTLKGSSGMYGFEKVGHLMHLIENIFEKLRGKQKEADNNIINLTLEVFDFSCNVLKSNDEESNSSVNNYQSLINKIQAISDSPVHLHSIGDPELVDLSSNTLRTYFISFTIDNSFIKRGIKLESIFEELNQLGTVISIPLKKNESNLDYWEIFLVSNAPSLDIEDVFIFMLDITTIEKLAEANLFQNNEFKLTVQKNAALKKQNNISDLLNIASKNSNDDNIQKPKTNQINDQVQQNNKNFLRVAADKLDEQMDLLSELVTAKAELRLIVENEKYTKLFKLVETFDKVTNRFRKNILNVRLVQVKQWYVMFLRLIRDVSKQLGKEVDFLAEGLETEIDKNIIDSLEGPLTHLLRNSLDHGIETPDERIKAGKPAKGSITLKAYHSGAEIIIEIIDDGRGFDKNKIRQKALSKGLIDNETVITEKQLSDFVFLPGFSTTDNVTEVSGRGVGMDVVKKAINQLRGEIEIISVEGEGTTVIIRLPMLLSIIDTLLIRSENQYFAIPLSEVHNCSLVSSNELDENINDQITLAGELIPYINLRKVFGIKGTVPGKQKIVILESNNRNIGLITDEVIGEYQAVLKPFDGYYINKQYFIGASLLADGHLCVILDTLKLLNDKANITN
jgi:two-component system, chemotaxis family, sensor kinase CheA